MWKMSLRSFPRMQKKKRDGKRKYEGKSDRHKGQSKRDPT